VERTLKTFQFHIGAIKREHGDLDVDKYLLFQFHIGAIKREEPSSTMMISLLFQFHIGAIKRQKFALKNKELSCQRPKIYLSTASYAKNP
jgi:hypothetical protein